MCGKSRGDGRACASEGGALEARYHAPLLLFGLHDLEELHLQLSLLQVWECESVAGAFSGGDA